MDQIKLNEIVTAWIAGEQAKDGSPEHEANWWAISEVLHWAHDGDGDRLWEFILATYTRDLPDEVVAVLAAGPLEDLLTERGPRFIDRVEELARKDPKFNFLLGGVWRNAMNKDIWRRVKSARKQTW